MTEPQPPPITVQNLRDHLQDPIAVVAEGESAIRVAGGWLRQVTGLTTWPDPLAEHDPLFGWWVELAGLIYDNPRYVSMTTVGAQTVQWSQAAAERRRQILDEAAAAYAVGGRGHPLFEFPPPRPWPV